MPFKFCTFSFLLIFGLTHTSIAPATPHSEVPNSGLENVTPFPLVPIRDLVSLTQKTLPILQLALQDAFTKVGKLAVRKGAKIKRRLEAFLKDGLSLADPIIQSTLESIHSALTFEEFAPRVQSTLQDLQSIIALVSEQSLELMVDEAPYLEDKAQTIFNQVAKDVDNISEPLFAMVTAANIVVSVTAREKLVLMEQAEMTLEEVKSIITTTRLAIDSLMGEEGSEIDDQLRDILEETINVGSERINLLFSQLDDASVENAPNVVEQAYLDLESLLRQAFGEVKEAAYMAPAEYVSQCEEILGNLVSQADGAMVPFLDLVSQLGSAHVKGL